MTLSKVLGQRRARATLGGLLQTGRIPSALLFAGSEGVGKTLAAHELAKALICREGRADEPCGACHDCQSVDRRLHPDVKAVNAVYQAALRQEEPEKQKTLRVETIRHLRRDMEMRSLLGGWKIAVIEDAHALEPESANALLKILEEPPERTLWILITSQRERITKTVISRCFSVPFAPLPADHVQALLEAQDLSSDRAQWLAALAEGSVRRALDIEASPGYPQSLADGPLAAVSAAESLPKELYLARTQAELALFALAQDLRLRHLNGLITFSQAERPLRTLQSLRQALRANADPRLALTVAAIEYSAQIQP